MLILPLIAACSPFSRPPSEDELPYRVEELRPLLNGTAGDLDLDGQDELINWYSPQAPAPTSLMAVVLRRQSGELIDQVNFAGSVSKPWVLDVFDDPGPEIIVPLIRGDSLFASVLGSSGSKIGQFLLTTGSPRVEPEGTLPWDPVILNAMVADVDGIPGNELVTVIATRYARLPRGVFVHSLPGGELKSSFVVGANLTAAVMDDFDEDGLPEILAVSAAGNNGADAGGLDDSRAYLILFDLAPEVRVARTMELPVGWGWGSLAYVDFDADGHREIFVSATGHGGVGVRGNFRLLDPVTWRVVSERQFDESVSSPVVLDLDRDLHPEIVAIHGREIRVYDYRFNLVRRRLVAGGVERLVTAPDIDGDGLDELIALNRPAVAVLLEPDLTPRATWPGGEIRTVVKREVGAEPWFIIAGPQGDYLARLIANPFFLLHRYGLHAALATMFLIAVVVTTAMRRLMRDNMRLRAAHAAQGEPVSACLVDRNGRVRWTSPELVRVLEAAGAATNGTDIEKLDHAVPGVAAALFRRLGNGASSNGYAAAVDEHGFTIEPAVFGDRGDPHWVVRVRRPHETELAPATWALMAQRVAHGLKNPLTSMLLTLRRMEMEYREHAPGVASRLDHYSGRIEERIEELRRQTSNFLKFVDLESPRPMQTDVNALVREYGAKLERTLPPDIRLDMRLRPQLPIVWLDAEQVVSALENLVANAINEMSNGGMITISTAVIRDLQWSPGEAAVDHVTIEVADTGMGVPAEHRPHLFEPGWTGREGGSGLGLAITRKIMRDHGGRITLESEVGSGSVFTMFFPAAGGGSDNEAAAMQAGTSAEGR